MFTGGHEVRMISLRMASKFAWITHLLTEGLGKQLLKPGLEAGEVQKTFMDRLMYL